MDGDWGVFKYRFLRILKIVFFLSLFFLPLGFLAWNAATWNFLSKEESPQKSIQSPSGRPSMEQENIPEAPVPADIRQQIISQAEDFLSRWETYEPAPGGKARYLKSLRPFLFGGGSDIADRKNVSSLPGLCPGERCSKGSQLAGAPNLRIVGFSGTEASLVGSGLIRIRAPKDDDLSSAFYTHDYELLMGLTASGWRVVAAAAQLAPS